MTTRSFLWGLAAALAGLSVIGWLIVSSLKSGNAGTRFGLVYRDSNPLSFWAAIFFYILLGLLFLAMTIKLLATEFAAP